MNRFLILLGILQLSLGICADASAEQPNVLFIAIDDLNDWVGCLEGHPQVQTPNIDRLAKRGVSFANAHCQAPICMPSRTSLLTSTYPWQNGVYMIEQDLADAPELKNATTLPQYFRDHGYTTLAAGKIYHRPKHGQHGWDQWGGRTGWNWMGDLVGPEGVSGLPSPSIFDFGPIPVEDSQMNDAQTTQWAIERLGETHDQPFFLAVGLITPHLPLFTPAKYYEMYPLRDVQLPPVLPGDLDDLPPLGRKFTRYFDTTPLSHLNVLRYGVWNKAVASYLACASFTDACVGQLLDALDRSEHADNTVIVLWSDHGFHLGEKMHWEKRSLWEESTRVPLIFAGPGVKSSNQACSRPVGLIDIYPTLVELCDLPANAELQGRSLVPLLSDPAMTWNHPALTTHHPGNHAVRTERWRYIRYANGDEELYDHNNDPNEWHNLAAEPSMTEIKKQLGSHLPTSEAPYAPRLPRQKFTQEFDWSRP
ncbi:sulfatase [Crateriforma conspicua]|uniref:Choline-sulfatase n=1 Tax=Crateriforma conspicua TaxID=2527996 RepID=A0A5C6FQP8_9PLAN|nr:sulfatase [Crateriforma conspicua]TWU64594.1 Choline-sulfatase [Crateriforma conspicua]